MGPGVEVGVGVGVVVGVEVEVEVGVGVGVEVGVGVGVEVEVEVVVGVVVSMSTRFSKYFRVDELACRDGNPVPVIHYGNAKEVCQRADKLRELVGPLLVNSGYRTQAHNKAVGGSVGSLHLSASALDLRSPHFTGEQLAALYKGLIRLGVVPDGGIGTYESFVHIDIGPARRWRG